VDEPDLFQFLTKLNTGDLVWLVAVLMREKPIATLVVPFEVGEWFRAFCEKRHLVRFEDKSLDPHHTRVVVCRDKETAELYRKLGEIRSLFDDIRHSSIISHPNEARDEFIASLTRFEGRMYGYPECCIELHAESGPSSRARAYEELLESGKDRSIPIEFWAVAHAPCSSTCDETLALGRKYFDAVAELSEALRCHIEARLLLPRFYQTGGGRFIELQSLDYDRCRGDVAVSMEQFEKDAVEKLPKPISTVLCEVPHPRALVCAQEDAPYKTSFPNPDMVGTMWLAYSPGFGAYMVNAKTGQLALYIINDKWIEKVGEEWRSKSNFRVYRSVTGSSHEWKKDVIGFEKTL